MPVSWRICVDHRSLAMYYGLNACVPLKLVSQNVNAHLDGISRWGCFWEVIRS